MTHAQCRAARGLLDWTEVRLADASGVAASTVTSFERSSRVATPERIQAMRAAIEAAGVEFTNGDEPGVKLRKKGRPKWICDPELD